MQFQSYKIADLIPASYNPRKKLKPGDKEYEKIKNSIREFGYVEPIIINSDMTIIGGHQRATVLADLGYTEVECIVVDIDKNKEKALNVALNKITGEWNKELLADLIKDLEDSEFDVSITGFEPPEIEQLFNSVHDKKIMEDDFDGRMVPFAVFHVFDKIQLIAVIHDLEALDILEFHHIGQVIDNKDIIPALIVQTFYDVAADKTGTTRN